MKDMEQIQTEMNHEQKRNTASVIDSLFFGVSKAKDTGVSYTDEKGRTHVVVYTTIDTISSFELDKVAVAGFRVDQIGFDGKGKAKRLRLDLVRFN